MDMNSFMDAIMKMWPDWAATQGIEPPDDGFPLSDAYPADQPGQPMAAQPPAPSAPPPVTAPDAPRPQMAPPEPLPPAEVPPPAEAMPMAGIDPQTLIHGTQPGMQPVTNEQLLPPSMLQIPQAEIDSAPPIEESNPMQTAIGAALSGIKTPSTPQYSQPSAPGMPGIKDINPTLLAVLQAAGLQAPQTPTGLGLGHRIR